MIDPATQLGPARLGATSRTQRWVVRSITVGLALLALTLGLRGTIGLGLVPRLASITSGQPVGTVSAVQPVATVTVGRSVTVQVAPTAVTGSGEWRGR